ncbi:MAG: S8 family serine peptidase [Chloroflexota bacterium]|nr:S8 family serine peptidase [Chloroflexota bacterium]
MRRLISLAILAAFSVLWAAGVAAQPDAPMRVIITFKSEPGFSDEELVRSAGGSVRHRFDIVPSLAAEVPSSAIASLRADARVASVEEDYQVRIVDTELDNSWGVKRIGAGLVHPTNQGVGVKVAIIDTGIDYRHSDLNANYVGGYDFVNRDSDPLDDHGHGTLVAGVVAAEDNGAGVVGVAPQAQLYALKVLSSSGWGYVSDIIAALQWAQSHGIQVVNMSLGSSQGSLSFQAAVTNASNAGIVVVAAAGNSGDCSGSTDTVSYPARYAEVIAVGATDSYDSRPCFSSMGPTVELAAPGVSVRTTYPNGSYAYASGTSLASPHVAGAAALVLASGVTDGNGNGRTNDEVRARFQQTADDLGAAGRDTWYGYGLVDADEAVGGGGPPPPASHDVAVTGLTAPASVTQGSTVQVTVAVANQGSVAETFSVTLEDTTAGTVIGSTSVSLGAAGSTTASFSWNTTGVATGAHTLTATAAPVSGETDTADNSRSASVTVNAPSGSLSLEVRLSGTPRPGQKAYVLVKVTNGGTAVSGALVTVTLDTRGMDRTSRKYSGSTGWAVFSFYTTTSDRLPWTIRASAAKNGSAGSKTCTYNGSSLSCS